MFGMGFTEILFIAVIAVLFLGPDKLPTAMVEIAKFFKNVKSTISTAKDSIEEELHVSELKQEALKYKKEIMDTKAELTSMASLDNLNDELDEIKDLAKVDMGEELVIDQDSMKKSEPEKDIEEVTFKKKSKKEKLEKDDIEDKDVWWVETTPSRT